MGCRALCVAGDIAEKSAVDELAKTAVSEMGQVDLLFNNAGVLYLGETRQMELADWEWIVEVNLWGPVRLTHALLPHMIERRTGHIVSTASIAGLVGTPGLAAYSLTKSALVGFSEALRVEVERYGVAVSVVCPGPIKTNLNDNGRFGSPGAKTGTSEGLLTRTAYSAQKTARRIVRGIRQGKGHIVITPMAHAMWSIKRLSPELGYQVNRLLWRWLGKNMGISG